MTSMRRWINQALDLAEGLSEADGNVEIVYRVEHKDSRTGPYVGNLLPDPVRKAHPDSDGMINWEGKAFGFDSLDQLKKWFSSKQRAKLRANGYVVAVYHATHVEHGITQAAFDLSEATLVDTLPIPR